MERYYVYMLQCFDGTFYVGVTNDVERRVWEHNEGTDAGSYTAGRRPVRLVYVSDFAWIDQAIAYEKQLKHWSHRKKRALAQNAIDDLKRFAKNTARQGRANSLPRAQAPTQ